MGCENGFLMLRVPVFSLWMPRQICQASTNLTRNVHEFSRTLKAYLDSSHLRPSALSLHFLQESCSSSRPSDRLIEANIALSLFSGTYDPMAFGCIWDPFLNDIMRIDRRFAPNNEHAVGNTKVDWRETSEAHIFTADIPGLKKEEVNVEILDGRTLEISGERKKEEARVQLLDGETLEISGERMKEEVRVQLETLKISGERKKEEVQKSDTWHRVERSNGNFSRRFRLPENSNVDQGRAQLQDGVLTVQIPKEQQRKPQVRRIEISSGVIVRS